MYRVGSPWLLVAQEWSLRLRVVRVVRSSWCDKVQDRIQRL